MEHVIIERLCPIIKGQCLGDSCAWWMIEKNECHMFGSLQEGVTRKKLY
jgi:hypothetical protein